MSSGTKDTLLSVGIIIFLIIAFVSVSFSIPLPDHQTQVDGRVVKVKPFTDDRYFLVTFDLGNSNQGQYKISSFTFDLLDAYTGRMLVRLYGVNDVWWQEWDGIYSVGSITKLDNYGT